MNFVIKHCRGKKKEYCVKMYETALYFYEDYNELMKLT